jgi:hypothetical protein
MGQPGAGLCGACASGFVSRALGRLRDPPWGYYGPCARSSLTARVTSGHASADRSRKMPPVERREASVLRRDAHASQGVELCALRRSAPLIVLRGATKTEPPGRCAPRDGKGASADLYSRPGPLQR